MGLETKPLVTLHETASFDLADFPVPTGREEQWRFTPLSRLKGLHDGSAVNDGNDRTEVLTPSGVSYELVSREDPRIGTAGKPADRVAAQAYNAFEKAGVITVPKELVPSEPIVVNVHGQGGTVFRHLLVDVKPMAEAVVVLNYTGTGVQGANVEFVVGDGAKLTVVSNQDWDRDAVQVAQYTTLVGRDATFKSVVVTLGGDLVRISPRVAYTAPGGRAELVGLYFADAGQHLEHRLLVDHSVPNCASDVTYKGGLQGDDAHTVWIGDVIIRAEAEGTDTYELNRNLLLTDGARADSVPNLEILTGEIAGAGHASASGRLDDEHMFYLQARGIPADEARKLIVHGFFNELIQRIEVPEIQEKVLAAVEAELAR
ncbi:MULTISPECIES: Fe-S cluster assembly protein SufD [Herbidospora]|uniref:Fe-S cluster assembly protein SufD n=1 Tax=Herbidospora TaxID=28443 RepID=UPI0007742EAD|nr:MULTISPECIES: Fe-S cluster assembly protein SufD [Herbidospora]